MTAHRSRPVHAPDLLDRLRGVFSLEQSTIARSLDPDFNRYFRDLLHNPAGFDAYLEEVSYIAGLGLAGHVLDLAAGFGVAGICLRALGVQQLTCMDLQEIKVSTGRKLADFVQADRIRFIRGNARNTCFVANSFDGVLVKDAVSHFSDPSAVFAEVARIIKSGGRLVIWDDRNALNSRVRAATEQMWQVSENGSPEELARVGMKKSFTQMRLEYLRDRFPELDDLTARTIAEETRGHTYRMLDRLVQSIAQGKPIKLQPFATCINPENEIAQEQLMDPRKLARQLGRLGLSARVDPTKQWDPVSWKRSGGTWKGVLRRRLVHLAWPGQKIWPNLIRQMPVFIVVATKRRGPRSAYGPDPSRRL